MNRDIARLEHMIDACEKIIRFTNVDYSVYDDSDEKLLLPVTSKFWEKRPIGFRTN